MMGTEELVKAQIRLKQLPVTLSAALSCHFEMSQVLKFLRGVVKVT